jgi:hypothetical protein
MIGDAVWWQHSLWVRTREGYWIATGPSATVIRKTLDGDAWLPVVRSGHLVHERFHRALEAL